MLANPTLIYFNARTLIPENAGGIESWHDYYYDVRRRYFLGLAAWALVVGADATIELHMPWSHPARFAQAVCLTMGIAGAVVACGPSASTGSGAERHAQPTSDPSAAARCAGRCLVHRRAMESHASSAVRFSKYDAHPFQPSPERPDRCALCGEPRGQIRHHPTRIAAACLLKGIDPATVLEHAPAAAGSGG